VGWIDYQTGRTYAGGWQKIEAGGVPAVILVRDGVAIPHAAVAQSTDWIDWTKLELVTYVAKAPKARGLVCLPSDNVLRGVTVDAGGRFLPPGDPLAGKVRWTVRRGGPVSRAGMR
jgi:alpha-D-xyloside xylohydrolase